MLYDRNKNKGKENYIFTSFYTIFTIIGTKIDTLLCINFYYFRINNVKII